MKKPVTFIFLSLFNVLQAIGAQINVFEDLLYWHASQETTSTWAFVQTTNLPPGYVNTEPNVYFGWSPGLKLGAKVTTSGETDFKLNWTYFSSRTHASLSARENEFILPQFFNGFLSENLFNAAQLDWKLMMNMVDGELGQNFHPLPTLMLRPFIGVKGGTINQAIHSAWQENLFNLQLYSATENLKHNFLGVGPSFGIDSSWHLFENMQILSDFSASLLWGHWNIEDTYHRPEALSGLITESTINSNTSNALLGSFMTRYFMGVEWSFLHKTLVSIKLGYEMQFWSNQLRLPLFQALPVHGDLTLQGGTCGILIDL